MFTLNVLDVIACLNGLEKNLKLKNLKIKKIVTNHKEAEPNSIFIALRGKKFDGHDFTEQAIKNGADFVVVDHEINNIPQIIVKNTVQALSNIAALNRKNFKGPLIAITGSTGKTTTKDLIALALSSSKNILKTEENLNNEIGLPQTLLKLNLNHTAAIVEMGMSHKNEISNMSLAAKPTISVLTNIGKAHIQNFKNIEEILNAKLEILDGMPPNGTIIFNADDEKLKNCDFKNRQSIRCSIKDSNADIFANNIEQFDKSIEFIANIKKSKKSIKIKLPLIGLHNVLNTLFSIATAQILNLDLNAIAKKLETFKQTGLRQKILNYNNIKIFVDCYNASPESMTTTLKTISQINCNGRKFAVLGDMLELGKFSTEEHQKIGTLLDNLQFDEILCIGDLAELIAKTTKKNAYHFKSAKQLSEFLKAKLKPHDLILFKASRAINLENVIKKVFHNLIF